MAYVNIIPLTAEAEGWLLENYTKVRATVRSVISRTWAVDNSDIIVNAHRNTTLYRDPVAESLGAAPDFVIEVNTSDTHLENRVNDLIEKLIHDLTYNFGIDFKAEIWINFFHSWGITFEIPDPD